MGLTAGSAGPSVRELEQKIASLKAENFRLRIEDEIAMLQAENTRLREIMRFEEQLGRLRAKDDRQSSSSWCPAASEGALVSDTAETLVVSLADKIERLKRESQRIQGQKLEALREQYPNLSAAEVNALYEENRRREILEYRNRVRERDIELTAEFVTDPHDLKRQLRDLDEDVARLKQTEREPRLGPTTQDDNTPEDLRDTWGREDRLGGYDSVTLEEFGCTTGRMPTLGEIEEDHSDDLP